MTLTRSKVKVKVTEHLNFRQLHISRSISSATFACTSKLMVDSDTMAPGLQLVGARFSNFLPRKLSREFKFRRISIFHEIQRPYFGTANARVTWLGTQVALHVLCMLTTLTRSRVKVKVTDHLNFRQLPITARFQVYILRHFRVHVKTDR